jgi:pimeloyl-ACP methyl ester carboxylesterase
LSSEASAAIDARAESVFQALRDGRIDAAADHFDVVMREGLPPSRLAEVWTGITRDLGALVSWTLRARSEARGKAVRTYDLRFERGRLVGVVAVDPWSLDVAGLHFRPAGSPAPTGIAPEGKESEERTEEVRIGPPERALAGVLTLPAGSGPFAAAVLVHGSGPQDHNATVGGRRPFHDLARGLALRGVATLRFAKRSHARPKDLDACRVTADEEVVMDAVAAVRELRHHAMTRSVFLIGHSLGAFLAPDIAWQVGHIAGLVLLAPPGRPVPVVVLEQLRRLGAPDLAWLEREAQAVEGTDSACDAWFLGAPAGYWRDLARRRPVALTRELGTSVLVIRGSRDDQVSGEDLEAWRLGLAGLPCASAETMEGMDHLLAPAGASEEGVSPRLLDRIAGFVHAGSCGDRKPAS